MQIGNQNWPFKDKSLGFNIPEFNSISLTYDGDNVSVVTYLNNSVTVAELTLTYVNNKLTNVEKTI